MLYLVKYENRLTQFEIVFEFGATSSAKDKSLYKVKYEIFTLYTATLLDCYEYVYYYEYFRKTYIPPINNVHILYTFKFTSSSNTIKISSGNLALSDSDVLM